MKKAMYFVAITLCFVVSSATLAHTHLVEPAKSYVGPQPKPMCTPDDEKAGKCSPPY